VVFYQQQLQHLLHFRLSSKCWEQPYTNRDGLGLIFEEHNVPGNCNRQKSQTFFLKADQRLEGDLLSATCVAF